MEIENAFYLLELMSRSTNKMAPVHIMFLTRNSTQFPPITMIRLLSQNNFSGKDQSAIANLHIHWNSWL